MHIRNLKEIVNLNKDYHTFALFYFGTLSYVFDYFCGILTEQSKRFIALYMHQCSKSGLPMKLLDCWIKLKIALFCGNNKVELKVILKALGCLINKLVLKVAIWHVLNHDIVLNYVKVGILLSELDVKC